MIGLFEKLNVRPEERRMVIAVFFTAFIVFNGLWAWKYLSGSTEWNEKDDKLADLNKETQGYQKSIKRLSVEKKRWEKYMEELKERSGEEGGGAENFDPFIRVRNMDHWKSLNPSSPRRTKGSEESGFDTFEKQEVRARFRTGPYQLMLFLRELGDQKEMIRLNTLNLKPVPPDRKLLSGEITIIASLPKANESKKKPPRGN